jgi:hypothetical protein
VLQQVEGPELTEEGEERKDTVRVFTRVLSASVQGADMLWVDMGPWGGGLAPVSVLGDGGNFKRWGPSRK